MCKILTTVFLVLATLSAQEVWAANWKPLGIASLNGVNFIDSVDIASLRQDGDTVEVWTRSEFIAAQPLPSVPGKLFKAVNELTVYNCKNQTKAIRTETYFDSGGHTIKETSVPATQLSFSAVESDTVGELEMRFVCRLRFI